MSDDSATIPARTTGVCILGLGLIGGSLLRALPASTGVAHYGYNRSAATVEAAVADGFDASTDLAATLRRAAADDALIVLATPVTTIGPLVDAIADFAPNCLLTDVISVQRAVSDVVAQHHPNARYIGGHPMAGTSHSGWQATDPALFTDAIWVVDTPDDAAAEDWLQVATMARSVGAAVVPAAADAHDRAVAAISHLPHLTAAATAAVGAGESDLPLRLAAGSFRDGTRVAGSAPELQRAMIEANSTAVLNVLSETIDRLTAARDQLRDQGRVSILIEAGHRARTAYEEIAGSPWAAITGVTVGDDGWPQELRRQGHLGRVWLG